MLVFIDESGDIGLKVDKGSSALFVIAIVIFKDHSQANECDKRIESLRTDLGLGGNEFKFAKLPRARREAFLKAVLPFAFSYYGVVVNKSKLYGEGFRDPDSFYKYTCKLVMSNAKAHLQNAIVVIDGSGSRQFKIKLSAYLQKSAGAGALKKIKIQSSHNNNLIQLADMVVGVTSPRFLCQI